MRMLVKVAKWFAYLWLALASLLFAAAIILIWLKDGFGAVQEIMSPFNVMNVAVTVVTFAPGLLVMAWVEKQERKFMYGETKQ
jgi:hypothetical protein